MKGTREQYNRRIAARKGVIVMTSLSELKNYNVDALQLEELIHLDATAIATLHSYEAHGVDAPEWLTNTVKRLRADIKQRNRDVIEKKLSEARSRQAQLKTTEEKRTEAALDVEKYTKLLNA
jgi:uncharacterized membrane protein YdfJ with MMPL/SSD domain